MKAQLESVIDELKRLRDEGVSHVHVSEESIQDLRDRATSVVAPISTSSQSEKAEQAVQDPLQGLPENMRSTTPEAFGKLMSQKTTPSAKPAATKEKPASDLDVPPEVALPEGSKQQRWEALRDLVLGSSVCNAHTRDGCKVVFGVGNIEAEIFFCGEAPGADEEKQGEPFVGRAGQLLNKMIQAMGLQREDVYIGNIMNWRPEHPNPYGNRPPTEQEMNFCLPYLQAQVDIVQPKLIVALGVTAAKGLLGYDSFRALRQIKGDWQDFRGMPVMPTYHPSYLLHNSSKRDKRSAWEDLLKVMEKVELPISDRQRNFFL